MRPTGWVLISLTLILLLGATLRIVNLGDQPLWTDEGFSGFAILQPDLMETLRRDVHPPLYFAALKVWANLTGLSELALRWFTILPSLLSIALIVPLSREVARLRAHPIPIYLPVLAALLMALAEMEFYIAQEVRSYSLHVCLALLSTWGFLRWQRTDHTKPLIVWLISMTALIYTHYLGAWMGVIHGLYALIFGRRKIASIAFLLIPAALFSVWLFAVVLPYQTAKADSDATIDPSTLETLINYAHGYLTHQWPLMLGLFVLGLVNVFQDERPRLRPFRASGLLLLWVIVPVALTFIGNLRFSIMTAYRISLITPALVLVWAFGLSHFPRQPRLFLIAVLTVYGVFNVDFYRPKFPEREFAALASTYAIDGDVVLVDMKGADFSPLYYLARQLPPQAERYSLRQYAIWDSVGLYQFLIPRLQSADTVWVLRWNDEPLMFDLLRPQHTETAHRVWWYDGHRLEAYRFDKPSVYAGEPLATFGPLTLHTARVYPDTLRVDLWWSAQRTPELDFTTSAILLNESGQLVAQLDSTPFLGERQTSTWQPDSIIYEPKPMKLIDGLPALPAGRYQVAIQVYRLTPALEIRQIRTADDQPYVVVGEIIIEP